MSPMHVKLQDNDVTYKMSGMFKQMATAASTATLTMQHLNTAWDKVVDSYDANAYTWTTTSSATNGAAVYYDAGTSSGTGDQWVYVYNDPPQVQTYPARKTAARRSAPKEFNKYLNGSDLLEEFIAFLGTEGVRQGEVMALPLELFIKWLIIRAAEADQEEPPVVFALPAPKPQPRCLGCQRYMHKDTTLPIHDTRCADRHFARAA